MVERCDVATIIPIIVLEGAMLGITPAEDGLDIVPANPVRAVAWVHRLPLRPEHIDKDMVQKEDGVTGRGRGLGHHASHTDVSARTRLRLDTVPKVNKGALGLSDSDAGLA